MLNSGKKIRALRDKKNKKTRISLPISHQKNQERRVHAIQQVCILEVA